MGVGCSDNGVLPEDLRLTLVQGCHTAGPKRGFCAPGTDVSITSIGLTGSNETTYSELSVKAPGLALNHVEAASEVRTDLDHFLRPLLTHSEPHWSQSRLKKAHLLSLLVCHGRTHTGLTFKRVSSAGRPS